MPRAARATLSEHAEVATLSKHAKAAARSSFCAISSTSLLLALLTNPPPITLTRYAVKGTDQDWQAAIENGGDGGSVVIKSKKSKKVRSTPALHPAPLSAN